MDDRPPIGMTIKRARERKRLSQADLADALDVSQKTIDNWEHDRSYPKSSIGAIEEVLGVNLGDGLGVEPYVTQDEATIWSLTTFTEDERTALIRALREERGTG
jgi:transcriptional regulator with XRE-family HTH domain